MAERSPQPVIGIIGMGDVSCSSREGVGLIPDGQDVRSSAEPGGFEDVRGSYIIRDCV